ncbi:hypothetical protein JGU66_15485 [Myxococcaceae bacterium JPH2]|nr:hypothetical protein [Myxococcaceae bacterium JPH2]
MRWHWMLGLLCMGCASVSGSRGQSAETRAEDEDAVPTQETVYLVPLDEALMMTRHVFEDMKYDVFERAGTHELYTSAHEPGLNLPGNRSWERYFVRGVQVAPRQSVVRVFRLRYSENEMKIDEKPKFIGDRLAEEEKYLSRKTFIHDTFEGVPAMEGFKLVRGTRDLEIERRLLARLEMVPSLELVGGNASVPMLSMVSEDSSETETAEREPADCGAPLPGDEALIQKGHVLMLADPLGTRELPEAATRLLCDATARDVPVSLALSLPASEQRILDAYMTSEGRPADLERLLRDSAFWRRAYQDGRSSSAMLRLVEQARRLRASGRTVSVIAFDSDAASGNAREAEMEQHLMAHRAKNPDAWTLVLAGDVHVRTVSVRWDRKFEPLGARLSHQLGADSVKALDVGFQRGTQFACRFNVWEKVACDTFALSPNAEARQGMDTPRGVRLFSETNDKGFHGRLYVGTLSASAPVLRRSTSESIAQPVASH